MLKYIVMLIVIAPLFSLAFAAPAQAAFFYGSGWSGASTWNSGWRGVSSFSSGPGGVFAFSSSQPWQTVNWHNQWVTWQSVTPVGRFGTISHFTFAQPTHFGFFNPVLAGW